MVARHEIPLYIFSERNLLFDSGYIIFHTSFYSRQRFIIHDFLPHSHILDLILNLFLQILSYFIISV